MAHCDDRAKERCRRDNTEDNRRREEDVKKMRKNKREQIFTGRFDSNARGFGFVTVEGFERDLFIPQGCTGGAVYGDTVEVRITRGSLDESGRGDDGQGKRAEAEVTRILEHGVKTVVGTFHSFRRPVQKTSTLSEGLYRRLISRTTSCSERGWSERRFPWALPDI